MRLTLCNAADDRSDAVERGIHASRLVHIDVPPASAAGNVAAEQSRFAFIAPTHNHVPREQRRQVRHHSTSDYAVTSNHE
jgi:hypothetical protein